MIQNVKTTIRWKDSDGNVLGMFWERNMDLPSWGKKEPMRKEIVECINHLIKSSEKIPQYPKTFEGYALKAFRKDRIVQIKSKTNGSFINLRNDSLSNFMENYI